jgi:hypothetical protein
MVETNSLSTLAVLPAVGALIVMVLVALGVRRPVPVPVPNRKPTRRSRR